MITLFNRKNIEDLQKQFSTHSKYFEDLITVRRSDFEKQRPIVSAGEGERTQDEIRKIIAATREIENNLLVPYQLSFNFCLIIELVPEAAQPFLQFYSTRSAESSPDALIRNFQENRLIPPVLRTKSRQKLKSRQKYMKNNTVLRQNI